MASKPACIPNEFGELTCLQVIHPTQPLSGVTIQAIMSALQAQYGYLLDAQKANLLFEIIPRLLESLLPDEAVPFRSQQILVAIDELLVADRAPSSVLLFHYSKLPAAIMGSFFVNRGDMANVAKAYQEFSQIDPHNTQPSPMENQQAPASSQRSSIAAK